MVGRGNWAIIGLVKESREPSQLNFAGLPWFGLWAFSRTQGPVRNPAIPQFCGGWLHQLSNAVWIIEESFREVLKLAGIVPMQISGGAREFSKP